MQHSQKEYCFFHTIFLLIIADKKDSEPITYNVFPA